VAPRAIEYMKEPNIEAGTLKLLYVLINPVGGVKSIELIYLI
jgi:hypothetical protein